MLDSNCYVLIRPLAVGHEDNKVGAVLAGCPRTLLRNQRSGNRPGCRYRPQLQSLATQKFSAAAHELLICRLRCLSQSMYAVYSAVEAGEPQKADEPGLFIMPWY